MSYSFAQEIHCNLLENNGFEEWGKAENDKTKDFPTNWIVTNKNNYGAFSKCTDKYSGSSSLKGVFDNNDGVVLQQNLTSRLIPGFKYKFGGRFKNSGLYCNVDWCNQIGIYFGDERTSPTNAFPMETNGEWKLFDSKYYLIPEGFNEYFFRIKLRGWSVGTMIVDELFASPDLDIVKRIEVHKYRQEVADEIFEILSEIDMPNTVTLNNFTFKAEILDENNRIIITENNVRTSEYDKYYHTNVDARELSEGWYKVRVTLSNTLFGKQFDSYKETKFHRIPEKKTRTSYIDEYNRLIIDGEPIFPIGSSLDNIFEEDVETYLYDDAPFNYANVYVYQTDEKLKQIKEWSKGRIKIMQGVGQYSNIVYDKETETCYYNKTCPSENACREKNHNKLKELINNQKDNDMIFSWYINEESPECMIPYIEEETNIIRDLDPNHPIHTMLKVPELTDASRPTFDAIGTDPFPLGGEDQYGQWGVGVTYGWAVTERDHVLNARAQWISTQVCSWSCYINGGNTRMPTYEEMRVMAYAGIAGGANGLGLIQYRCLKIENKLNVWKNDVVKFSKEIMSNKDIWLSIRKPNKMYMPESNSIKYRIYRNGNTHYILLVNIGGKVDEYKFSVSEYVCTNCKSITKLTLSKGKLDVDNNGNFTISMPVNDVALITITNPIKCEVDNCDACDSDNNCSKCSEGYLIDSGKCKMICDISNCNKCVSENYCEECDSGFRPQKGECVDGSVKLVLLLSIFLIIIF